MAERVSLVVVPGAWTDDVRRTVASAAGQRGVTAEVLLVDDGRPSRASGRP